MDSSDQDPFHPPPPMTWRDCVICNLEVACLVAGLVAFIWFACDPGKEDAEASRALQWTGSIGRAFAARGWEVVSVDLDPKFQPTICCDVMELDEAALGHFDFVWASPVCTEYSRALTKRPRNLEAGDRLVLRTLEIIENLRPRWWAMENPQTGLLKTRPMVRPLRTASTPRLPSAAPPTVAATSSPRASCTACPPGSVTRSRPR